MVKDNLPQTLMDDLREGKTRLCISVWFCG